MRKAAGAGSGDNIRDAQASLCAYPENRRDEHKHRARPRRSLSWEKYDAGKKHDTLEVAARRMGRRTGWYRLRTYYSFCVVRDPLDRFASHYSYLKADPTKFPELKGIRSLDDYAVAVIDHDMAVIRRSERIRPQSEYVTLGGKLGISEVLRYEQLGAQFSDFCQRLGLGERPLPYLNISRRKYRPSPYVRRVVMDFYRFDYEIFGY